VSDQDERDPFALEKGLDSPHITPDIPETTWDQVVWQALREAIDLSESKKDVFQLMRDWNDDNDPKLKQASLDKKVLWGLTNWDTKYSRK